MSGTMGEIRATTLGEDRAALWYLGQAGVLVRHGDVTIAVDPYLSDSAGKTNPAFSRMMPVPIAPEELEVDLLLVTHDHLDHLDPETVGPYRHKDTTCFVAPRFACRKLARLGVPEANIVRVDAGDEETVRGITIQGVYAVPTGPDVLDTCGYRLELPGGKSLYHASDTAWGDLLERAAPEADLLLACINGKFGNLNVHQAVRLAKAVQPRIAVPMHYDMMALNAENPAMFIYLLERALPDCDGRIMQVMDPMIW